MEGNKTLNESLKGCLTPPESIPFWCRNGTPWSRHHPPPDPFLQGWKGWRDDAWSLDELLASRAFAGGQGRGFVQADQPWAPTVGWVRSARPLTVLRRRTARAGVCTAPQQPAPRGRSRRNPGPGSRHGWSPSSLLLGGLTLSGSRGKQNTGKLSWCPHGTRASSTPFLAWELTCASQAAECCNLHLLLLPNPGQCHLLVTPLDVLEKPKDAGIHLCCAPREDIKVPELAKRHGQCHPPESLAEG